jgi:dipeptidase E
MTPAPAPRLMLIGSSYFQRQPLLAHCAAALGEFLGGVRSVLFVPYAGRDWAANAGLVRQAFAGLGIACTSIEDSAWPEQAVSRAEAIYVGGGNTFRLLKTLYDRRLIEPLRAAARRAPYLGASAGANIACPSIMTTNDMPIVQPPSLEALGLVPFQINPHFVDADPASLHMGETREQRIAEFLEVAPDRPLVIGLREGSWIVVERGAARLEGTTGARRFARGETPREWDDGPITLPALAAAAATHPGRDAAGPARGGAR